MPSDISFLGTRHMPLGPRFYEHDNIKVIGTNWHLILRTLDRRHLALWQQTDTPDPRRLIIAACAAPVQGC